MTPASELATKSTTAFPGASPEYEAARKALLANEIEFRRHMTRVGEQRRDLPPGAGDHDAARARARRVSE
jgi:predicted dithiol-disulfide oxidoreductase (DUF899 family)